MLAIPFVKKTPQGPTLSKSNPPPARKNIIPICAMVFNPPNADPTRPWGEASAVKALDPTTAPHTEHPTSITPKKVEVLRKGVGDVAIKMNPVPPKNKEIIMVGTLPHLSRSIPKTGNAIKVKVPITIMGTAPLKEAASELKP